MKRRFAPIRASFTVILEGLAYPEDPYYSTRDDCLYLVEWAGDRVLRWRAGDVDLIYQTEQGSGPSGLSQDRGGNLWLCLYSGCQVVQIDRAGHLLQVIEQYRGQAFKGPNDLVHDGQGGFYFTDSGDYQEDWRSGRPAGSVYYYTGSGDLWPVASSIAYPNGITLSPDRKQLYVAEHRRNRILTFDIRSAGQLAKQRVFASLEERVFRNFWDGTAPGFPVEPEESPLLPSELAYELGPDGLSLGADGYLWAAQYGGGRLVGFDSRGNPAGTIDLPDGSRPTNLCYHAETDSFYITEADTGRLLRCRMV